MGVRPDFAVLGHVRGEWDLEDPTARDKIAYLLGHQRTAVVYAGVFNLFWKLPNNICQVDIILCVNCWRRTRCGLNQICAIVSRQFAASSCRVAFGTLGIAVSWAPVLLARVVAHIGPPCVRRRPSTRSPTVGWATVLWLGHAAVDHVDILGSRGSCVGACACAACACVCACQ